MKLTKEQAIEIILKAFNERFTTKEDKEILKNNLELKEIVFDGENYPIIKYNKHLYKFFEHSNVYIIDDEVNTDFCLSYIKADNMDNYDGNYDYFNYIDWDKFASDCESSVGIQAYMSDIKEVEYNNKIYTIYMY